MDNKEGLSVFIRKRRNKENTIPVQTLDIKPTPWFKRPLEKNEFSYKLAKNGKYYVKHKEWGSNIWIGPYHSMENVNQIIESYVIESLKAPLDKKTNSEVHSVIIDNPENFF